MSTLDDQIRAMIEKALRQNRKAPTTELFEEAARIKKSIRKLKLNQFRGRYVLAVSRKLSGKTPGPKKGQKRNAMRVKKTQPYNEAVREAFQAKKSELDQKLELAYEKAIGSDRISTVERLLTSIDNFKNQL